MVEFNVKEMMDAGIHFGHPTHKWNPRMKPYIYGSRNGLHIIDLQKTVELSKAAFKFISKTVSHGGSVLFVGTKRQAQPLVEEASKRAQMFYVTHRWLGGTLTNFKTINSSIERLKDLENKRDTGGLDGLTKKEKLMVERDIQKLTQSFGGIKGMGHLPSVIVLFDPFKEKIALEEARKLGITVVALADTNCNPEGIDYLIPGNDDSIKSIRLMAEKLADVCLEGLSQRQAVTRDRHADTEAGHGVKSARGSKGKAYVSDADTFDDDLTSGQYSTAPAVTEVAT